ncbi:DUF5698 domain-containing protein [Paramaledivibacter caminithermalis]|jgi:uncharacterized protein YebE (UPF0316 family)|uniref:Uncharacterized protein YebE, UPF0316 family n=1 Tax=Paramaledivibacter caminithermalis (strain DSM 15212 / CIP 107654 / DViRD3) TaxID=1121301 RepID=A0A1M6LJ22_PARC5|nr:DUF5698 domain-containing protein [Paramaledivibacter caminithermalis]SHJ71189.1 Uncharacterized protein YebE, UPF0316 family [Paramaledivibacter caminithermalis DSM 15212]
MTVSVIFPLIGLFLITSFTNILATLKTILISKKIMNPVYFVVFIDAMIFATVVTKVTSSKGLHFTMAYALGRTMGVFIGNKLEERLALGILEVDIFLNSKNKMIQIAEKLRGEGYTVNNFLARGNNGNRRYKVEVVIKRKEFTVLENIMNEYGVSNPTLKIKNLSKVNGKISTTRIKAT